MHKSNKSTWMKPDFGITMVAGECTAYSGADSNVHRASLIAEVRLASTGGPARSGMATRRVDDATRGAEAIAPRA